MNISCGCCHQNRFPSDTPCVCAVCHPVIKANPVYAMPINDYSLLAAKAAESDKWKSLAGEFVEAAAGLSHGEDWNNGTHAKLHGYRQKLLDVLAKAREAGL